MEGRSSSPPPIPPVPAETTDANHPGSPSSFNPEEPQETSLIESFPSLDPSMFQNVSFFSEPEGAQVLLNNINEAPGGIVVGNDGNDKLAVENNQNDGQQPPLPPST